MTGFNDSAQFKILQKFISSKWVPSRQTEVMKPIVFAVVWRMCPRMKHTTAQFIPIIWGQFLSNQIKWHEHPRRASLLIPFLLSCYYILPPTQFILKMTLYLHCMMELKQLGEHSLYILFCPLARNLIFLWLLHHVNINTVFCWCDAVIIGFCMCSILLHVQFLRQYSP